MTFATLSVAPLVTETLVTFVVDCVTFVLIRTIVTVKLWHLASKITFVNFATFVDKYHYKLKEDGRTWYSKNMHICARTHTHTHTYCTLCLFVCMYVCVCVCVCIYVCNFSLCLSIYPSIYLSIYLSIHIYIIIHTYIHQYIHSYIHSYIHTYIHVCVTRNNTHYCLQYQ